MTADGILYKRISMYSDCIQYNRMTPFFGMPKKLHTTESVMNNVYDMIFISGQNQKNSDVLMTGDGWRFISRFFFCVTFKLI